MLSAVLGLQGITLKSGIVSTIIWDDATRRKQNQ